MKFLAFRPQIAMLLFLISSPGRSRSLHQPNRLPERSPAPTQETQERSLHAPAHHQAVQHLREVQARYHLDRRPF